MKVEDVRNAFGQCGLDNYVAPVLKPSAACYELGKDTFRMIGSGRLAGYDVRDFKDISQVYDLIYEGDRDLVIAFSVDTINYFNATQSTAVLDNQSKLVFRVDGMGGKRYSYVRHGIANGVGHGEMVSNFSYLDDITWMKPRIGAWQLIGAACEYFDFDIPEIATFKGILSPCEIRVLKLVARGFHSRDIAEGLRLSRHTVDTHRRNMLKKMEAANTPELLTLARDVNLLE